MRAVGIYESLQNAPTEQRFAAAVAAFGQRLRNDKSVEDMGYAAIAELANGARGDDPEDYRAEFVRLVRMAETLEATRR